MKKENEKFMTELFRTYGDRMYYLARRIVTEPPDAEDVVQIALESLMKKTEFLRSLATPALEAYINTTVNHAALNFLRAENREKRKPERMAEQIDLNVTENGFECILRPRLNLVQYSAAREVADINVIIENMSAQIKKRTGTSIVTEIELVMNYVVAQDEDGKYRIVYSPIWRVEYFNQINKDADWKRFLMTFDGYTGELNYDSITY